MRAKINLESGQVMLTMVVFSMFASIAIVFGVINPILKQVAISKDFVRSKESFYLAESGLEDAQYRVTHGKQISTSEILTLNNATTTTLIQDIATGKQITSLATSTGNSTRKMQISLALGTGISFHYGIQSGQGGFYLQNSSSVIGNIYAGGTVSGSGNYVYGDVVSSGASGLINGIHATGTARAHTINNSTVDKDAYYMIKTSSTVTGTSYPNSADPVSADLPISDSQIAEWESDALAGGTVTCSGGTYTINSNVTIGPKKIPCDLLIKGSGIVITVAGPLWVTGNIDTQTSPTIKMAAALGSSNIAIIADNPSNTTGSGIINIGQNTAFQGSGSVGSYVFMISQNNSSETGGSINAIQMGQGASALVAYAAHGQVTLQQSVSVKEVTAFKIILQNTANVIYDTGLPSALFESGPAGGYDVTSWKEIE
ncbi:hypothetical protein H0W91_03170 [Patescibacteria group bacterium]|nr:hypothetical protein [Patescibacteria group bacterium]